MYIFIEYLIVEMLSTFLRQMKLELSYSHVA